MSSYVFIIIIAKYFMAYPLGADTNPIPLKTSSGRSFLFFSVTGILPITPYTPVSSSFASGKCYYRTFD